MTRMNRQDTLFTELREMRRRLRLLETTRAGAATAVARGMAASPGVAVPLLPARPSDWPATDSAEWEPLVATRTMLGQEGARLAVHAVTEGGAEGSVRVTVDGVVTGGELPASPERSQHDVVLAGTAGEEVEVTVEARRSDGDGVIRAMAFLILSSAAHTSA